MPAIRPARLGMPIASSKHRLLDYQPFGEFEVTAGAPRGPDSLTPFKCLAAEGLQARILRDGIQPTTKWLNSTGRNATKLLKSLIDMLPGPELGPSSSELYEKYRQSLLKQMAA
jgi:hypothetical protein